MKNTIKDSRKVSISLTISKFNLEEMKKVSLSNKESISSLVEKTITEYLERQMIENLVNSYKSHPVGDKEQKDAWDWSEFDIDRGIN